MKLLRADVVFFEVVFLEIDSPLDLGPAARTVAFRLRFVLRFPALP